MKRTLTPLILTLAIGTVAAVELPPSPPGAIAPTALVEDPDLILPPERPDGLFHLPLATRYPSRIDTTPLGTGRQFHFERLWKGPAEIHWQESAGTNQAFWVTVGKGTNTDERIWQRGFGTNEHANLMIRALVYPYIPPAVPDPDPDDPEDPEDPDDPIDPEDPDLPPPDDMPQPIAIWLLTEGEGTRAMDTAGDNHLDLGADVAWSADGLRFEGGMASMEEPPAELMAKLQDAGELTLAVWLTADGVESGDGRVVTISQSNSLRNLTLFQRDGDWVVRLRTSETSLNGIPAVEAIGAVTTNRTSLVYTRDRTGDAMLWIDGEEAVSGHVGGTLENWDPEHRLAFGNEWTMERPWNGTIHRVEIYDLALSSFEVRQLIEQ